MDWPPANMSASRRHEVSAVTSASLRCAVAGTRRRTSGSSSSHVKTITFVGLPKAQFANARQPVPPPFAHCCAQRLAGREAN